MVHTAVQVEMAMLVDLVERTVPMVAVLPTVVQVLVAVQAVQEMF